MAINGLTTGVNNISASYESLSVTAEITKTTAAASFSDDAAVYEKSTEKADKNSKVDFETIDKLKADAERRTASLRSLVEKMFLKQAGTAANAVGLADIFKQLEVPEEVSEQAKKDIAEDGYWGIEQTSDRIVSFAKALAGDDVKLAESMLDAIKEGFKLAGEEWGEDLPEISQKTIEATYKKMEEWISFFGKVDDKAAAGSTTTIKVSATYSKTEVTASKSEVSAAKGTEK